jgi:hypothetical protein
MRYKVIFSLQGWITELGELKSLECHHGLDFGSEIHLQLRNVDKKVLEVMIGSGYFHTVGSERIHTFPASSMYQQVCTILVHHRDIMSVLSLSHHFADLEIEDNSIYIHAYGRGVQVMHMKVADND